MSAVWEWGSSTFSSEFDRTHVVTAPDDKDVRAVLRFAGRNTPAAVINVLMYLIVPARMDITIDGVTVSERFRRRVFDKSVDSLMTALTHFLAVGYCVTETVFLDDADDGTPSLPRIRLVDPTMYRLVMARNLLTGRMRTFVVPIGELGRKYRQLFKHPTDPALQERFRAYVRYEPDADTGALRAPLVAALPRARFLSDFEAAERVSLFQRQLPLVLAAQREAAGADALPVNLHTGPEEAGDQLRADIEAVHRAYVQSMQTVIDEQRERPDAAWKAVPVMVRPEFPRQTTIDPDLQAAVEAAERASNAVRNDTHVPSEQAPTVEPVFPHIFPMPPGTQPTIVPPVPPNPIMAGIQRELDHLVCTLLGVPANIVFTESSVRGSEASQAQLLQTGASSHRDMWRSFVEDECRELIFQTINAQSAGASFVLLENDPDLVSSSESDGDDDPSESESDDDVDDELDEGRSHDQPRIDARTQVALGRAKRAFMRESVRRREKLARARADKAIVATARAMHGELQRVLDVLDAPRRRVRRKRRADLLHELVGACEVRLQIASTVPLEEIRTMLQLCVPRWDTVRELFAARYNLDVEQFATRKEYERMRKFDADPNFEEKTEAAVNLAEVQADVQADAQFMVAKATAPGPENGPAKPAKSKDTKPKDTKSSDTKSKDAKSKDAKSKDDKSTDAKAKGDKDEVPTRDRRSKVTGEPEPGARSKELAERRAAGGGRAK